MDPKKPLIVGVNARRKDVYNAMVAADQAGDLPGVKITTKLVVNENLYTLKKNLRHLAGINNFEDKRVRAFQAGLLQGLRKLVKTGDDTAAQRIETSLRNLFPDELTGLDENAVADLIEEREHAKQAKADKREMRFPTLTLRIFRFRQDVLYSKISDQVRVKVVQLSSQPDAIFLQEKRPGNESVAVSVADYDKNLRERVSRAQRWLERVQTEPAKGHLGEAQKGYKMSVDNDKTARGQLYLSFRYAAAEYLASDAESDHAIGRMMIEAARTLGKGRHTSVPVAEQIIG